MTTKVTCEDLDGGLTESMVITDDWLIVVDGKMRLHHVAKYANGTAVITVKKERNEDKE